MKKNYAKYYGVFGGALASLTLAPDVSGAVTSVDVGVTLSTSSNFAQLYVGAGAASAFGGVTGKVVLVASNSSLSVFGNDVIFGNALLSASNSFRRTSASVSFTTSQLNLMGLLALGFINNLGQIGYIQLGFGNIGGGDIEIVSVFTEEDASINTIHVRAATGGTRAVPSPSTLALVALGGLAFGFRGVRKLRAFEVRATGTV